jgi:hypothetical protein
LGRSNVGRWDYLGDIFGTMTQATGEGSVGTQAYHVKKSSDYSSLDLLD